MGVFVLDIVYVSASEMGQREKLRRECATDLALNLHDREAVGVCAYTV